LRQTRSKGNDDRHPGNGQGKHCYMRILRQHQPRLAAAAAFSYLLLWLALMMSPCLMAVQAPVAADRHADMQHGTAMQSQHKTSPHASTATEHACRHCPPVACDLAEADALTADCDSVNVLLQALSLQEEVDPGIGSSHGLAMASPSTFKPACHSQPPPLRAGPRRHLLHLHFNE